MGGGVCNPPEPTPQEAVTDSVIPDMISARAALPWLMLSPTSARLGPTKGPAGLLAMALPVPPVL